MAPSANPAALRPGADPAAKETASGWLDLPLFRAGGSDPSRYAGLEAIRFERLVPVLDRTAAGSWCDFGVRDPALLTSPSGMAVREQGALVMYFSGSRDRGRWQGLGRAISVDDGTTWRVLPQQPVLAPRPGKWDSGLATGAWVVRTTAGEYRAYYRGGRAYGVGEGIGLAVSADGIHFERAQDSPILAHTQFPDIPPSAAVMGVINVVRTLDGRFLLMFEAKATSNGGRVVIMGAVSEDGYDFTPLNGGRPLFAPWHLDRNAVSHVANPRIMPLEAEGLYLLAFNAHAGSGHYWLGFAFSRDLESWWEHPGNPLILPSGGRWRSDPFSGRIEGGVIVKDDMTGTRGRVRMYAMGIPHHGASHRDSVIGRTTGEIRVPAGPAFAFSCVADGANSVGVGLSSSEILSLRQGPDASFETRVHFPIPDKRSLGGLYCEIKLDHGPGAAYLLLTQEPSPRAASVGIEVRFMNGRIETAARRSARSRPRHVHLASGVLRRLVRRLGGAMPPRVAVRAGRWHSVGRYRPGTWHRLTLTRDDATTVAVCADDGAAQSIRTPMLAQTPLRYAGFASSGMLLQVRRLAVAPAETHEDLAVESALRGNR